MKILFVCAFYRPYKCGIGDYVHQLAKSLSISNDVYIFPINNLHNKKQYLYSFNRKKKFIFNKSFFNLYKITKIINPNIIHYQDIINPNCNFFTNTINSFIPYLVIFKKKIGFMQTFHEATGRKYFISFLLSYFYPSFKISVRPKFEDLLPSFFFLKKKFYYIGSGPTLDDPNIDFLDLTTLRKNLKKSKKRLFIHFGFIYSHKGIEKIIDLINKKTDIVYIIGEIRDDEYFNLVLSKIKESHLEDNFIHIPFLDSTLLYKYLVVADAILLLFSNVSGSWNSSVQSAIQSKSFVLTTSFSKTGYDSNNNIFYANPNDFLLLKKALNKYSGNKNNNLLVNKWKKIAKDHLKIYMTNV